MLEPARKVCSAWAQLYSSIRGIAAALKINAKARSELWVAQAVIDELEKNGSLLDPVGIASGMVRLLNMRNQAIHGSAIGISVQQPDDYANASLWMEHILTDALRSYLKAEQLKSTHDANEPRQSSERDSADPA